MTNLLIPRIFHRIWFGNAPMPREFEEYAKTWERLHPDWEMRLWTEDNLIPLINQKYFELSDSVVRKADIARYEIIYRFGGIYIDCDFECIKNIEPLIEGLTTLFAKEDEHYISISILGGIPHHESFAELIMGIPDSIESHPNAKINHQTGPVYATKKLNGRSDIHIFPSKYFYPYHYTEAHCPEERLKEAYAIHHWAGSWL